MKASGFKYWLTVFALAIVTVLAIHGCAREIDVNDPSYSETDTSVVLVHDDLKRHVACYGWKINSGDVPLSCVYYGGK